MINWTLLGGMLVVLLIFLATSIALLSYVRHWSGRHAQHSGHNARVTEGVYFKRYVPPELRPNYDARNNLGSLLATRRLRWLNAFFSTGVVGLLIGVLLVAVFSNRDRMLATIDLTEADLAQLDIRRHQWVLDVDDSLPQLQDFIPAIAARGVTLVGSPAADQWLHQGAYPGLLAREQWATFLNAHDIPFRRCRWRKLLDCHAVNGDSIYVVTTGRWNLALLDQLLAKGASVLLYGAPAQVLSDGEQIDWQGLHFEPYGKRSHNALAMVGDQLLSLGMDAGLVMQLVPAHEGYRARSSQPQAVAIGEDARVGGTLETRIYAHTAGAGRLVWSDVAPHRDNHYAGLNMHHLDALNAAIFRYLLREEYGSWSSWPAGHRFAGLIEEDTEDGYQHAERVAEMVREENFPITWFVLSNLALQNRALTRTLAEVGEVACHGDNHADFNRDSLERQVERLARCGKVLHALTGRRVRGFRPPREAFNADTVEAVFANHMDYYFPGGEADRAVPTLRHNRSGDLVSLPRLINDDYELWHERQLDYADTVALVTHEMDWIETLGGLYPFSFHSQYMVDQAHLEAVRQIGTQLRERNAWFATAGEIADWWRVRHKLVRGESIGADDWVRFQPTYAQVNREGQLIIQPRNPLADTPTVVASNSPQIRPPHGVDHPAAPSGPANKEVPYAFRHD